MVRRSGRASWGFWSQGRGLCLFLLVALFVALEIPGAGNSAVASGPQCGDTVTSSVVLTKNLTCSGDGLYVEAASNLTLDLQGHLIRGSGSGFGVYVQPSQSDVVIEDGRVSNFGLGIEADNPGTSVTLDRLSITDNGFGVVTPFFEPDVSVVLSNSTVARNRGDGVFVGADGGDFRIVNDIIRGNGGDGINAFEDSLRLIADSFIVHNRGNGAELLRTVATVDGNTFLGNGGVGLTIFENSCSFFPFYNVSDNFAVRNAKGGMAAYGLDTPCVGPPGSGNAARNNGVFQCILIVCAENPGQAKRQWDIADPRVLHSHR